MVLVFAKNSEGALDAAHEVAHKKLGYTRLGCAFDYYVDFTREDTTRLFGKGRWGPIPPVLQVSTARFPTDDKRGLEMVNYAMEINRETFKKNMAIIRYHIARYTDDQLFDEVDGKGEVEIEGVKLFDNPFLFRHYFGCSSGELKGPNDRLYGFKGETISSPMHLRRILNDSDCNPWYIDENEGRDPNWGRHIWNQPLWVVPFDVHF